MPTHHITFRDGVVVEQEEPPLYLGVEMTVYLDGEIRPIGAAFARLIAERARLVAELDKAKTEIADLKAGGAHA